MNFLFCVTHSHRLSCFRGHPLLSLFCRSEVWTASARFSAPVLVGCPLMGRSRFQAHSAGWLNWSSTFSLQFKNWGPSSLLTVGGSYSLHSDSALWSLHWASRFSTQDCPDALTPSPRLLSNSYFPFSHQLIKMLSFLRAPLIGQHSNSLHSLSNRKRILIIPVPSLSRSTWIPIRLNNLDWGIFEHLSAITSGR